MSTSASPKPGSASFELFLRERRQPLLDFLRRLKVQEQDAQDIVQESLARLLRYRDSEPAEAWQALLYRIAINLLRDRKRRATTNRVDVSGELDAISHEVVSSDPSPEQYAIDRQALSRLRAAILRLPLRCREVYLLHRIEGMSYAEIARRNEISLKAVEKNISRALRHLRAGLEPQNVAALQEK